MRTVINAIAYAVSYAIMLAGFYIVWVALP